MTGLRERGNATSKSTGRSGRQNAATRRNMRREERVTVQGPVKEQPPDGTSQGGGGASLKTPAVLGMTLWGAFVFRVLISQEGGVSGGVLGEAPSSDLVFPRSQGLGQKIGFGCGGLPRGGGGTPPLFSRPDWPAPAWEGRRGAEAALVRRGTAVPLSSS